MTTSRAGWADAYITRLLAEAIRNARMEGAAEMRARCAAYCDGHRLNFAYEVAENLRALPLDQDAKERGP